MRLTRAGITDYWQVREPDPANPDEPFTWLDDDEAAEQDRVEHAVAELTGAPKPWKILDATADDPLTGKPVARRLRAPEQHGSWVPPYYIRRDFDGWGPQEDANVEFRSGHAGVVRDVRFATQISIAFGEFLQAIFHEIGFFGAPALVTDRTAGVQVRPRGSPCRGRRARTSLLQRDPRP